MKICTFSLNSVFFDMFKSWLSVEAGLSRLSAIYLKCLHFLLARLSPFSAFHANLFVLAFFLSLPATR